MDYFLGLIMNFSIMNFSIMNLISCKNYHLSMNVTCCKRIKVICGVRYFETVRIYFRSHSKPFLEFHILIHDVELVT